MAVVFRIEKTRDYTVMSNHHLKNNSLSLKAKGLLAMMLSLPEKWHYSIRGLAAISKDGVHSIGSGLKELAKARYIQRETPRDDKGQITATEYTIFEDPHKAEADTAEPNTENPDTVKPNTENRPQLNTNKSNIETSNIDLLNTYPIQSNDVEEYNEPTESKPPERIGMDKILAYRQLVKKNIEYDILTQKLNGNVGMLNEIVDIIVETICTSRQYLTVASETRDVETVKSQLLKLNAEHIEYVIDCMKNYTTDVHDTRKYLLAALYNVPSTMDTYYTLKVNHDMYGGN